jgi:hypothetical protein
MNRKAMQESASGLLGLATLLVAGCGGAPPPPPAAPPPAAEPAPEAASGPPAAEAVDTGKDCAKAEGQCGGGGCNVTIKNACDASVRCELEVSAQCESQGGTSEAGGKQRDSIAAGATGAIGAQATCSGGRVLHTEVRRLTCK